MKAVRALSRFTDRLNWGLAGLIAVLMAVATAAVLIQVIVRAVLPPLGLVVSAPWTEETARYLMVWVVFIGVAVLCRNLKLIGVEIVALIVPRRIGLAIKLFAAAVCIGFFATLGSIGWDWTLMSDIERSPVLLMPMMWVYAALPVGAAIAIFNLLVFAVETLTGARDPLAPEIEIGD